MLQNFLEHGKSTLPISDKYFSVSLTINLEKCNLGKNEVKYLGHVIGSGGLIPDPFKVETIRKMSKHFAKKELRSLLRLARCYRDCIPNF